MSSSQRPPGHRWDVTPAQAREIQAQLAGMVCREDRLDTVRRVAGVDVGPVGRDRVKAAVAVLDAQTLEPLENAVVTLPMRFPYVPGLLSFREAPAVLTALEQLDTPPDLVLCDGQGIAHPRQFGIACHLGVLSDLPTIGVAKSRLVGSYHDPGMHRGSWSPLSFQGQVVGAVLRSRAGVKPVFVSIGHRVSLETAISWTMRCVTRYRLPETTRAAHRLASGTRAKRAPPAPGSSGNPG